MNSVNNKINDNNIKNFQQNNNKHNDNNDFQKSEKDNKSEIKDIENSEIISIRNLRKNIHFKRPEQINDKVVVNLSKNNYENQKFSHIEKRTYYDGKSCNSNETKFNLSDLDCLNHKRLGFKRRRIIRSNFDFYGDSKKNQDEVVVRVEIGTSKDDYLKLYKEIEKLIN